MKEKEFILNKNCRLIGQKYISSENIYMYKFSPDKTIQNLFQLKINVFHSYSVGEFHCFKNDMYCLCIYERKYMTKNNERCSVFKIQLMKALD